MKTGFALAVLLLAGTAARARAAEMTVGHVRLTSCVTGLDGFCGSIAVPLDRHGGQAGTLTVGFEFYPHTAPGVAAGVILAEEGGPGYSSTGSRDGYVRLFAPLRGDHDILLIDKRGTGRSSVVDCPALQADAGPAEADVAACAVQLGAGAWLYRTADAADDVADVLAALGVARVDYYGDSYGTWFGQVLAARHPDLLTTMVLDGAYPVFDDPSTSGISYGVATLDRVCRRSPACAALPSSAAQRFTALLASVRAEPVTGTAPDGNGEPRTVTADPAGLFGVIAGAGNASTTWRNLDAASRALLADGDALPLLRLIAEAQGATGGGNVHSFSVGLADAVQCTDFPVRFDYAAPREVRDAQVQASLATLQAAHPDIFAPFTVGDAADERLDPQGYRSCLPWPAPPAGIVPAQPLPPGMRLPPIPTLILSGDLDTVTTPAEGRATAALLPRATVLSVPNTGHETAIADEGVLVAPGGEDLDHCIGPIVRGFIASGGRLGDTSCTDRIRPIRTVPAFTAHWESVPPARPTAGNAAVTASLRLASAVAETVGDALGEFPVSQYGSGAGLRGGTFGVVATAAGYRFDLHAVRWAQDLAVDGTITWDQGSGAVVAEVRPVVDGHAGTLVIAWNDRQPDAVATITGTLDGAAIAAERAAP